ncbi:MAG: D-glycero-alpha-D-manno-heptose-7-phosphate kinase, partial [Parcubacteria group bacterium Gr01-1014_106]
MILTRAPLRVPLGGGGTDLPAYYSQYGGFLTSVGINKYVYIAVKRSFDDSLRVSYAKTELVAHASE